MPDRSTRRRLRASLLNSPDNQNPPLLRRLRLMPDLDHHIMLQRGSEVHQPLHRKPFQLVVLQSRNLRLSRSPTPHLTPPILQKIRQRKPIIQLRPPDIHPMQPNLQIDSLLRRGILQLPKLLARNQQPTPIAQPQHQELKPRLRPIHRFDDPWKALKRLRPFEGRVDLFVRGLMSIAPSCSSAVPNLLSTARISTVPGPNPTLGHDHSPVLWNLYFAN